MKSKKDTVNDSSFASKIIGLERGKKVAVLELINQTPKSLELAASVSKLVRDHNPSAHTESGTQEIRIPDLGTLSSLSNDIIQNQKENDTIAELLPDYEACSSLLVSSILSPKDLMSADLIYEAPADLLPPNLTASIIGIIQKHFDESYKIKNKLSTILRNVLFDKGSHIIAVLPENAIDDIINRDSGVSLESLMHSARTSEVFEKSRGLLGPRTSTAPISKGIGLESMITRARMQTTVGLEDSKLQVSGPNKQLIPISEVTVTDNVNVLRIPYLEDKLRRDYIESITDTGNLGIESYGYSSGQYKGRIADKRLSALIYKNARNQQTLVTVSKSQNQLTRLSVTGPLIIELPPESVLPVFPPGQPDHPVGFYVLLSNGTPVTSDDYKDNYRELQNNFNAAKSQNSVLVNRLEHLMNGIDCNNRNHSQLLVQTYADLVEQDLCARLRNGKYNNDYSLSRNEDVYRVMLSRVLSQRQTQILFLPVEQVTYFATRYNKAGIGLSLMDQTKLLNTQRAIVSLVNTMAAVRNSIGRTTVDIKLDPDDPDPSKRIEEVRSDLTRINNMSLPLAASRVSDMVGSLAAGQYIMKYSGHEGLPDMDISFDQNQSNYPQVDTDYEEKLRQRSIAATGLSVEKVDDNFRGESATSVVSSDIMLSRKVMTIQDEITPHITDHIRKVIKATPDLISSIREAVSAEYDNLNVDEQAIKELFEGEVDVKVIVINQIVKDFINGLNVTLPRPTTVSLENQKKTLEVYIELLDAAIDSWINDDMLGDSYTGEITETVRAMANSVRSYFIRQFCADNGILPELAKITTIKDDGKPEVDIYDYQTNHISAIIQSMGKLLRNLTPRVKESNAVVEETKRKLDESSDNSSDFGSGGGGDTGGDQGDSGSDDGNDDPFAGIDGVSGDKTSGDDEVTFNV